MMYLLWVTLFCYDFDLFCLVNGTDCLFECVGLMLTVLVGYLAAGGWFIVKLCLVCFVFCYV